MATVRGLPAFAGSDQIKSLVVLSLPEAVTVTQGLFSDEVFSVSIIAIGDDVLTTLNEEGIQDVEGPGATAEQRIKSRVLVELKEAVSFRVHRAAVIQVAIPDNLA